MDEDDTAADEQGMELPVEKRRRKLPWLGQLMGYSLVSAAGAITGECCGERAGRRGRCGASVAEEGALCGENRGREGAVWGEQGTRRRCVERTGDEKALRGKGGRGEWALSSKTRCK